jgi:hypothetical protein
VQGSRLQRGRVLGYNAGVFLAQCSVLSYTAGVFLAQCSALGYKAGVFLAQSSEDSCTMCIAAGVVTLRRHDIQRHGLGCRLLDFVRHPTRSREK